MDRGRAIAEEALGAETVDTVNALIEGLGGVREVLKLLERGGLGVTARSWVACGPSESISPAQIRQVLGFTTVVRFATHARLTPDIYLQRIAIGLPQAIDRLTPTGVVERS